MKLSELIANWATRPAPAKPERKKFRKGKKMAGLVGIPNKIRKRMSGAER